MNPYDRPKAILFARVDSDQELSSLNKRWAMLLRYVREHNYFTIYGEFVIAPIRLVEEQFLTFITDKLIPELERDIGLKPPYPITFIVCYWTELVSDERRPIFQDKLDAMGITVVEIGNK